MNNDLMPQNTVFAQPEAPAAPPAATAPATVRQPYAAPQLVDQGTWQAMTLTGSTVT